MPRIILGIETSCDETAAALIEDGHVLADRTTRQLLHEQYGGVVPELASRAHEQLLAPAVEGVLHDAGISQEQVEGIAVTFGPGLAGALLVGLSFAKGYASALDIPLWAVNHLEGHIWSAGMTNESIPLPFLSLIISGGHTLLVRVEGFGNYQRLGSTRDDAAGELFDKVGRLIGFPFPSGPEIDRAALESLSNPVKFPVARVKSDRFAFSFSGLKTAALLNLQNNHQRLESGAFSLTKEERGAICSGLMTAVANNLARPIRYALESGEYQALLICGGVSASKFLQKTFIQIADEFSVPLIIPPIQHCTDNGAMIAYAGYLMAKNGYAPANDSQPVMPSAEITANRWL